MKTNTSSCLKMVGEMVAGADHEIGNLLMMLEGSAHILLSKDPSPEAKSLALEAISEKTQRIQEVMAELRGVLNSGDKDFLQDNYVKDLITKAISLCRTRFKNHKIFFSINISEDSAIQCKETQLVQAILAVLTSCHDSIVNQKEKWIKVSVCDLEDELIIDVEDSGQELSEAESLELFQNPHNNRGGIALMWAKEILEAHKGKISIFNNENHPVTRIVVPRLQSPAVAQNLKIVQSYEIYEENVVSLPLRKAA